MHLDFKFETKFLDLVFLNSLLCKIHSSQFFNDDTHSWFFYQIKLVPMSGHLDLVFNKEFHVWFW